MGTNKKEAFAVKCHAIAEALPGGQVKMETNDWLLRARFRCTPIAATGRPDFEFVIHGVEPPKNVFPRYAGFEDVPRYDSDDKPAIGVSVMTRSGGAIAKDILSRLLNPATDFRAVLTERKAKRDRLLRQRNRHMREIEEQTGVIFTDRGPDDDPSVRLWGNVSMSLRLKADGSVYVSHGTIGKEPLIAMLRARSD